jgi:hypothetical protein
MEDHLQKNSISQQLDIANLHYAQLTTFIVDSSKRQSLVFEFCGLTSVEFQSGFADIGLPKFVEV